MHSLTPIYILIIKLYENMPPVFPIYRYERIQTQDHTDYQTTVIIHQET